ncbi:unnamed protein product [Microthlaspi erraticum]|uniref:Uncharacterized protein n=1 Tax=Microthlaspi erraticum TaxID=1685480 RepID=A0A6D2IHP3_9BRAS|nr:unnamed protein product [Microthlaspi erraticum]
MSLEIRSEEDEKIRKKMGRRSDDFKLNAKKIGRFQAPSEVRFRAERDEIRFDFLVFYWERWPRGFLRGVSISFIFSATIFVCFSPFSLSSTKSLLLRSEILHPKPILLVEHCLIQDFYCIRAFVENSPAEMAESTQRHQTPIL